MARNVARNVALVAAIPKSGLRIMPHSGGRVGRGIVALLHWSRCQLYFGPLTGPQLYFGPLFCTLAYLSKFIVSLV
jgi:hypothetical protein